MVDLERVRRLTLCQMLETLNLAERLFTAVAVCIAKPPYDSSIYPPTNSHLQWRAKRKSATAASSLPCAFSDHVCIQVRTTMLIFFHSPRGPWSLALSSCFHLAEAVMFYGSTIANYSIHEDDKNVVFFDISMDCPRGLSLKLLVPATMNISPPTQIYIPTSL